jgi:hypothetical protein
MHDRVRAQYTNVVGRRWPWPPCFLAGAFVSLAPRASADGSLATVRMVWVRGAGGESCPDGDELARRVTTRLGRLAFSSEARGTIEGFVERDDQRWIARVFVRDEGGALQGSRTLTADSRDCAALSAAVELVIAIALDPDAPLGLVSSSDRPAPVVAPAAAATAPSAPAPQGRIDRPEPRRTPPAPEVRADDAHLALSVRTLLAAGLLPGPALGVALGAEVAPARWPVHATAGLMYFPERTAALPQVAFGLSAGWVGACVHPLNGPRAEVALCGKAFVGAIHSSTSGAQALENGDRLWSAAAFAAQLRVRISGAIFAELGGEALAPFERRDFGVVGWRGSVFQEAPVCADAFAGLGVSIP